MLMLIFKGYKIKIKIIKTITIIIKVLTTKGLIKLYLGRIILIRIVSDPNN